MSDRDGTMSQGPGLGVGALGLRGIVLRVVSGPDRGVEHALERGTLVLGNQVEADLVLTDPTVSRQHVEIALLPSGVRVKDLGSKNGTFVGDTRVGTVIVPPGSEIRIGATRIELLSADAPVRELPSSATRFGRLVGTSALARRLFARLERLAEGDAPVVLHGAPGTGKSEAARALHQASSRARGPFIVLTLVDAGGDDVGAAFDAARGGTLVLDGLESASMDVQAAILAAIGDANDPRIVSTLRVDPRALVEAGRLRRDLWFRLGAEAVELAPLEEHTEDLPELVTALAAELGAPDLVVDALELAQLRAQRFDDNVRGLRRAIQEGLEGTHQVDGEATDPHVALPGLGDDLVRLPFKAAKENVLAVFERNYVAQLLEEAGGNVSRAAAQAGLDRNHVARLAKKHGLR